MCRWYEYELPEVGRNGTTTTQVLPNHAGPVIVDRAGERVVVDMRWGLTPWAPGAWLTSFRHPHFKTWKPLIEDKAQRCVVQATRFAEPDRNTRNPVQWRWFARPDREPLLFAGVWTRWLGDRGTRKAPDIACHQLYSIMTTAPNATVEPIHNRTMPVILTTPAEIEQWLTAPTDDALALQKPAANDVIELLPVETQAA